MNHPATQIQNDYKMTPNELSMLCINRYLSQGHMIWMMQQLNKQQADTLCIYINYIRNIGNYIRRFRAKNDFVVPKKLCFVVNVGKSANGTYIGSDKNQGCHWTAVFYEKEKTK